MARLARNAGAGPQLTAPEDRRVVAAQAARRGLVRPPLDQSEPQPAIDLLGAFAAMQRIEPRGVLGRLPHRELGRVTLAAPLRQQDALGGAGQGLADRLAPGSRRIRLLRPGPTRREQRQTACRAGQEARTVRPDRGAGSCRGLRRRHRIRAPRGLEVELPPRPSRPPGPGWRRPSRAPAGRRGLRRHRRPASSAVRRPPGSERRPRRRGARRAGAHSRTPPSNSGRRLPGAVDGACRQRTSGGRRPRRRRRRRSPRALPAHCRDRGRRTGFRLAPTVRGPEGRGPPPGIGRGRRSRCCRNSCRYGAASRKAP